MQNKTATAVIGAVISIAFAGQLSAEGNRYDKDRFYQAEISAAEAYLRLKNDKGHRHGRGHKRKPVLIDVRSLEEYAAGHPDGAYNVPFPRVGGGQPNQDPAVLYWEVYDIVKGRVDTPIMLLCRTGSRSVSAGNILADPDSDPATYGLEKFTNVFNIWEGFVGNLKYAYSGSTILLDENGEPVPLDLDNDGEVSHTADYADVYEEVTDANSDKDGWRNFQGLPWTTKIRRPQAYMRDPRIYDDLLLTPVE